VREPTEVNTNRCALVLAEYIELDEMGLIVG
jgi:hypothetical protein